MTAAASFKMEYVSLSEVVNDIRYLRQVKEFRAPPIDTSIRVYEDYDGKESLQ